jgi:transcription elongation GreA/GreB family factor
LTDPGKNPELFVWYFQLIIAKDGQEFPFHDKKGQLRFFESFLILFNILESKPEYRELSKKMYSMLSSKRYALVRTLLEGSSLEFINEFLLLVSKCQSLTDHDLKILRSLAEVVHPSLAKRKQEPQIDGHIIWTTEEGFLKTQERIKTIGTTEIVENAREIEAARALGDLRENSEYKFALEKRSRLQGELKHLSEQLQRARIITQHDIRANEVFIGSIVETEGPSGEKITYTLLGPWDADPDQNILSFQSKLAQSIVGLKVNDKFSFKDKEYTIVAISSIFDKPSN